MTVSGWNRIAGFRDSGYLSSKRPLSLFILMLLLMACSGNALVSVTNSGEARDADRSASAAP